MREAPVGFEVELEDGEKFERGELSWQLVSLITPICRPCWPYFLRVWLATVQSTATSRASKGSNVAVIGAGGSALGPGSSPN